MRLREQYSTPILGSWRIAALIGAAVPLYAGPTPPANDLCVNATPICTNMNSDPDLGFCQDGTPPGQYDADVDEVCSVAGQDCFTPGQTCVSRPPGTDAFRCSVPTDNQLATTDGPSVIGTACEASGTDSFQADVWYEFIAPCHGYLTMNMCDGPSYDAMVALYGDEFGNCACPLTNAETLKCDDDYCPTGVSAWDWHVFAGNCYRIRVGGRSADGTLGGASFGTGVMDIRLLCDPVCDLNPPLPVTSPPQLGCPKNRYLSFQPNNGPCAAAFRVNKTTAPTGVGYVGTPDANGFSRIVALPVVRIWTEPVIHVRDCDIVPGATYQLRTTDGFSQSSPLTLQTAPIPSPKFWGDTVGSLIGGAWSCPNGVVNTNDFVAALQKFQGLPTAPHITLVDVQAASALDPCLNQVANIADVFLILKAFQGEAYPFTTNPAACPVCP